MSIEEDRLVLNEYDAWQTVNVRKDVDLSVEAFLTEREHEHNALRITDALAQIPEFLGDGDLAHILERVRDILIGGRPYIMNTTLTGPPERIFT